MKRSLLALLLGGACLSTFAVGFTGPVSSANFSVANVGTLIGGSPVAGIASFTSTQLTMMGSNTVSPGPGSFAPGCSGGVFGEVSSPCQLQATIAMAGTYSFSWTYATTDADVGGDIFGVIVDGNRIAVSSLTGAATQSGNASFTALSSFGWFVNCTDCIGGAATATVGNFAVAAVPEPATGAMALLGGGVLGWLARRRAVRGEGRGRNAS